MKKTLSILLCLLTLSFVSAQTEIDTIIKITSPRLSYPNWSPDGTKILYEAEVEGNWEIYIMDKDGKKSKRLTTNKCLDRMPNWSPDGNEIVFISDRDGDFEVYRMDVNGNLQTQLTNDQTYQIHPYWSPNGNKIIYNSLVLGTRTYDVRTMNRDGTDLQIILKDDELNSYSQISPDGTKIVFDKWYENNEKNGEIYAMDIDGKNLTRLTHNEDTYDGYPTWFPDSKTILFSSEVNGTFKLFTIKADGTNLKQLTFNDGDDQRANVSKDGKKIVFNRTLDEDVNIYTMNVVNETILNRIEIDSIVKITNPEYAYAHWSPDGKKLVYQTNINGNWDIQMMDEDGKNIKNLTADISADITPSWSPDGKWVAFVSDRDGDNEIYIIDSDGKNLKQITHNNLRDIHPYWSPDSKSIIYNTSNSDDKLYIQTVSIEDENVKTLLEDDFVNSYASISPDGNKMIYVKWLDEGENGEIYVMDLKTKKEMRLTHNSIFDGYPSWFPDSNTVLFSSQVNKTFKLHTIKIDGTGLTELAEGKDNEVRANVSKDGKKIVTNKYVQGMLNLYTLKLK